MISFLIHKSLFLQRCGCVKGRSVKQEGTMGGPAGAKKLWLCSTLFLLQQLQVHSAMVKYLPGFQGPLPFEMETGYIGVGESEDVQLFYYFIKSEKNPEEDPLMLWLTGGPGCSSLEALLYEIGPLNFETVEYIGGVPNLVLNPVSWTQEASIIFLDSPVGTGFSYSTTWQGSLTGDFEASKQIYQFLTKWMSEHPQFLKNPFYVCGDSYTGKIGPVVTQEISDSNEAGIEPFINLKGYLLGNPVTDPFFYLNKRVPFAHGMALIPDELYESLQRNCGGEYVKIDPSNIKCLEDMQAFEKCISGLNIAQILYPTCSDIESPRPKMMVRDRRSLVQNSNDQFFDPQISFPSAVCLDYYLVKIWTNDISVRNALHVREGSIGEWQRCNTKLPYTFEIESTIPYHANLSKRGYRSIIYSGDHDMLVPFLATEAWIKSLNYSIVDEWRPWLLHDQVAGYTRTYSNHMTYATVKGAGHVAPTYKPKESFAMFKRWILEEPL